MKAVQEFESLTHYNINGRLAEWLKQQPAKLYIGNGARVRIPYLPRNKFTIINLIKYICIWEKIK